MRKAAESGIDLSKLKVTDVQEVPGKGIVGYVDGAHVAVGNMELMSQYACDCTQIEGIYWDEKHTAFCISIEKTGTASVCVIDDVRRDAVEAISNFKKNGVKTVMLTGDKSEIAHDVAGDWASTRSTRSSFPRTS